MVGHTICATKLHCPCSSLEHHPETDINSSTLAPNDNTMKELAKSLFHVGETLLYSNSGNSTLDKVIKIEINDSVKMMIWIKTAAGDEINTTHKTLQEPDNPEIGHIPQQKKVAI